MGLLCGGKPVDASPVFGGIRRLDHEGRVRIGCVRIRHRHVLNRRTLVQAERRRCS